MAKQRLRGAGEAGAPGEAPSAGISWTLYSEGVAKGASAESPTPQGGPRGLSCPRRCLHGDTAEAFLEAWNGPFSSLSFRLRVGLQGGTGFLKSPGYRKGFSEDLSAPGDS